MRKASLGVIFLTVLLDLVGFGIVLPLLPLFSRNFGAPGWLIGVIMGSYSLMQFLFSPIWGRWSDRVGRRRVLLLSTAFACVSYIVFALGCGFEGRAALFIFLGSRLLAGICGANIVVAQAYVADITPMEQRSRRMGLIGMAFGLGFIFGPAVGAFSVKHFGVSGPGWVAASLCFLNFVSASFFLKESWTPSSEHVRQRPRLAQWAHTLGQAPQGLLIGVFFLATFCFASFETTLGLVVGMNFGLDAATGRDAQVVGYLFTFCGVIGAVVQGGLIGRLVDALGEPRVIALSLLLVSISLAVMPLVRAWPALLFALAILAVGSSLTRPPVFGMLSMVTPSHEQGATFGVAQSAGSLARIVAPVFAGSLYQQHPATPYLICSAVSLVTAFIAWQRLLRPVGAPQSNLELET
jgi:MFS family permease